MCPRLMCLRLNFWMLQPLNKAPLAYYAPDRCVPPLDRATHGSHKAGSTTATCLLIGY